MSPASAAASAGLHRLWTTFTHSCGRTTPSFIHVEWNAPTSHLHNSHSIETPSFILLERDCYRFLRCSAISFL